MARGRPPTIYPLQRGRILYHLLVNSDTEPKDDSKEPGHRVLATSNEDNERVRSRTMSGITVAIVGKGKYESRVRKSVHKLVSEELVIPETKRLKVREIRTKQGVKDIVQPVTVYSLNPKRWTDLAEMYFPNDAHGEPNRQLEFLHSYYADNIRFDHVRTLLIRALIRWLVVTDKLFDDTRIDTFRQALHEERGGDAEVRRVRTFFHDPLRTNIPNVVKGFEALLPPEHEIALLTGWLRDSPSFAGFLFSNKAGAGLVYVTGHKSFRQRSFKKLTDRETKRAFRDFIWTLLVHCWVADFFVDLGRRDDGFNLRFSLAISNAGLNDEYMAIMHEFGDPVLFPELHEARKIKRARTPSE